MSPLREGDSVAWTICGQRYEGILMLCEGSWNYLELPRFCLVKERSTGIIYYLDSTLLDKKPDWMIWNPNEISCGPRPEEIL